METRPPPGPSSFDPDEDKHWDDEDADWLIGKYALVGITWLKADGETVARQVQQHGPIVKVDREGIAIDCQGAGAGETLFLPPATSFFAVADPGRYRLRSTGEVVVDPDVLATWSVQEPTRS
ncbi:MAG: hypothetical protein ABW275_05755 [Hansschlegelia sp.]